MKPTNQEVGSGRAEVGSGGDNDVTDLVDWAASLLVNVSGGKWGLQSPEWQAGVVRWRDQYACMKAQERLFQLESEGTDAFVEQFNRMAGRVYAIAVAKGFWERRTDLVNGFLGEKRSAELAVNLEALALVHEEVSEAGSALRHGNPPDDKVPEFSGVEAELADVVIRIMDLAHARHWRVGEAIVAKLAMNATRPAMHGKLA